MKRHPHIMVVDDDQGMWGMLNRNLQLEGYDVAMATDGSSALATLEKRRPDLIILDIVMPELDGFQVLDLIRQRFDVPVILLTREREVDSVHKALVLGADDYIRKPFRAREVVARVRAKLRHAGPGALHS